MTILDDLKKIKKLDKSKMADFIADLPKQCLKAYQQAQKITLPKDYQNVENIITCGVGGSAISGELVKNLTTKQLKKPIFVNRDWHIPGSVNKNSLVFLISYSGQTKETLSCAQEAIKRKAKTVIITRGGKLKKLAQQKKIPCFIFQYQAPARASLSYLLMPILVVLGKLDLINLKSLQITSSLNQLKSFNQLFFPKIPAEKNIAKNLAYFIFDHLPIIITPPGLSGVARRWKTQLAENSKNFSFFETEPEIFHNFIESKLPWRLKDDFVFLVLDPVKSSKAGISPKAKLFNRVNSIRNKSLKTFERILDEKNICWKIIPCFGDYLFTQTLSLVLLGDWVSFYLAILNEINPTPVKQIKRLKK